MDAIVHGQTPDVSSDFNFILGVVRGIKRDLDRGYSVLPTSVELLERHVTELAAKFQQKEAA